MRCYEEPFGSLGKEVKFNAKNAGKSKEKSPKASRVSAFHFLPTTFFHVFFTVAFLLLLPLYSLVFPAALSANVAVVDLTPPLEMKFALGGYGARMSQPAQGVHDSIKVKALVLGDGEKKYAVVTLDILGLPPNVKPQVLDSLGKGWSMKNVLLLPSHSHGSLDMSAINDKNVLNSPQIGVFQPELLQFVVRRIVRAVRLAAVDLQPVRIGAGVMRIDGMNRNRRKDAAVDRNLTLLRVDRPDGPLAVLVNWTAHPTFLDETDMLLSAGWPGRLQTELEAKIGDGATVMYYNGAQGDISPVSQGGEDHYEKAEIYGRLLAAKAFELYRGVSTRADAGLRYTHATIELPERRAHPLFKETGGAEYGIDDQTMKIILEMLSPETAEISALRLGDFMIVGAPGELACRLGLDIKKVLKDAGVAYPTIGGLANEWISYIMTAEQYENAGYETSVSFYGPKLGAVIFSAMLHTAASLTGGR